MDVPTNDEPFTVRVNPGLPAAVAAGDSDVIAGGALIDGSTVTGGLVAASVKTLFRSSRNSYWPGVDGIVTVHVRLRTPVPTYVKRR